MEEGYTMPKAFPYFPLYASLRDHGVELTDTQKNELTKSIKEMTDEQHETVYALIRAYHLDHDEQIEILPYGGKSLKAGIRFDVDCFPTALQTILYQFTLKI